MELLQLRYFLESAETESFVRTAEKYRVPPSSVSASVKRLEKELKTSLFIRGFNRITLSDHGKCLRDALREAFSSLDRALDTISLSDTDPREIRMLVRAMRSEITDRIITYKQRHPHIAFKTVFDFSETEFEKYDIIVDAENPRLSDYEKFNLFTTRIRLRAAADSPLCKKKLTLRQLANESFISIGKENGLSALLTEACKKAGFTPNFIVETGDLDCLTKCVEAGLGIGLAREYQSQKLSPKTRLLAISDFDAVQTVFCYYKARSNYGNVAHFLRFLQKEDMPH